MDFHLFSADTPPWISTGCNFFRRRRRIAKVYIFEKLIIFSFDWCYFQDDSGTFWKPAIMPTLAEHIGAWIAQITAAVNTSTVQCRLIKSNHRCPQSSTSIGNIRAVLFVSLAFYWRSLHGGGRTRSLESSCYDDEKSWFLWSQSINLWNSKRERDHRVLPSNISAVTGPIDG